MKSKLNQVFDIDPRSLALFRVCVAALLLVDLAIRLQDFSAMYTEEGILPLALAGQYHEEWRWSLHFLSASSGFQGLLFVLAGLCAVALLAGWHARLAAILSWVLLVSLHARMPLVLNAGDSYLRLLLFWSMFLPLGKAWSLDTLRRPQPPARTAENPALSVAGAAILLQVCIVYWYSGLAKLNDVWLGGKAMDHLLRYSMLVKPPGEYLVDFQSLLGGLTRGTVLLEIAGPFALLAPWKAVRAAAIALFTAFHIGIELTLHVGLFAFVSLTGLILFLPASFRSCRFCDGVRGRLEPLRTLLARWEKPLSGNSAEGRLQRLTGGRHLPWGRRAGNTLCLLFLAYVVASWDFSTLRYRQMPGWLKAVGNAVMLPQAWGMYHTAIPRDYWYIYRGLLRDGRAIDILEEGVLTSFEPASGRADAFPNHRWRRLHVKLVDPESGPYRQPLAEHLFRRWNEGRGPAERIEVLEMYSLTREVGRDAERGKHGVAPFARVTRADLESGR